MNYIYLSLFSLLLFATVSHAQKQNNVWTFGQNAGLDFNNINGPAFYPTQILSREGCASICDAFGQLLFYSNGNTVWNKNHQVMTNGTGLLGNTGTIGGSPNLPGSGTQSVAIAQSPANINQYYLFVLDSWENIQIANSKLPLRYSIVDMTLNNGLGDVIVTQKNILVDTGFSEKMVVVQLYNSYWLLTHKYNSPQYFAYRIDNFGFHNPIISNVGILPSKPYFGGVSAYRSYLIGEMKISPDKKTIALGSFSDSTVEIASFDTITGIVSNVIGLHTHARGVYGVEFSPNGSKLYISGTNSLAQYDLTLLPNITQVLNSKYDLGAIGSYVGLRLGPDQKIYSAHAPYSYIGRINSPDLNGVNCNYVAQSNMSNVKWGFGNYSGYIYVDIDTVFLSHDTLACFDSLIISAPLGFYAYQWSDGGNGQATTFYGSGVKWVTYNDNNNLVYIDTFKVTNGPEIFSSAKHDTIICFSNTATISAPPNYKTYLWSDGTTSQSNNITVQSNQTIWVTAKERCYIHIDTFNIFKVDFDVSLGTDTTMCMGDSILLSVFKDSATYIWQDNSAASNYVVTIPDLYAVTVTYNGCNKSDSISITEKNLEKPFLGNDTTLCFGEMLSIKLQDSIYRYLWQDGTTENRYLIDKSGIYALSISYASCTNSDTINVDFEKCDCLVLIPDAFTPNNDGRNDLFCPLIDCNIQDYSFMIYNRWGQKIFETTDPHEKWKGTYSDIPAETGVYYYVLKFINSRDKEYFHKGDITLIR